MGREEFQARIQDLKKLDPKLRFTMTPENDAVKFLSGILSPPFDPNQLQKQPHAITREFIDKNKQIFGNISQRDSLTDGPLKTDHLGLTHVVLEQKFNGIPILGAMVSVHFKSDGTVYMVNSTLEYGINIPVKPSVKADKAQDIALKNAGTGAEKLPKETPLLVIASADYLRQKDTGPKHYLCWQVYVNQTKTKKPAEWVYYVDAVSGSVLFRYDRLIATGTGYYSSGSTFHSALSGGTYISRDDISSAGWPAIPKPKVNTYDNAGSTDQTITTYRTDADNIWGDDLLPPREADERAIVDVHRYLGYILNYYYNTFGHNSWNNAGDDISANVHYRMNYNNAFWSTTYNKILVCDGDGVSYDYFGALDILAHEFTHGVNDGFNVVQIYSGETGALNEAIADTMASFVCSEYPAEDTSPWVIGEKISLTVHPRSLADPARDDTGTVRYDATSNTTKLNSVLAGYYPDHYDIRYTGSADYNGVHCNCTIVGHAHYLMANGGVNRISGISVSPIGEGPVEQMIYYLISTPGMLTNSSNFADYRRMMIQACQTLYPGNLDYLMTVKQAFKAVGIGPDLYIRDSLSDLGNEPGVVSCMSPDIICRNSQADAALLAQIGDTANGSLSQSLEMGQDNYIYLRIFNGGNAPASGTLRLYVSPVSTFCVPASWTEVGHYDFPSISPGSFWVPTDGTQCIVFPGALTTSLGTGHFCFIGVIENPDDPAPDRMQITSISQFHNFIAKSNNYAWRNCDIVDNIPYGSGMGFFREFTFHGLLKEILPFDLEIDARDLPAGAKLVVLPPAAMMRGVKFLEVMPLKPNINISRNIKALLPVTAAGLKTVNKAKTDFAMDKNALVNMAGAVGKDIVLKDKEALNIKPAATVRISGIQAGTQQKVGFMIQFAKEKGPRDVHIAFRQLYKGAHLGQMNYIFKLR